MIFKTKFKFQYLMCLSVVDFAARDLQSEDEGGKMGLNEMMMYPAPNN